MKKDKPIGTKAFREAWKRHQPSRDSWGVEYVYDFGAFAIWKAAIRWHKQTKGKKA